MGIYEGNEIYQEQLLSIAKECAIAAMKVPLLTGDLELKTKIITDDDFEPIIEVLEVLGKTSAFQLHDATAYRAYKEKGILPPVLLIGADLTKPPMWNCGGCGFKNCGEYLNYVKKNKGIGIGAYGPTCLWKIIDFGIACDYACACAAQHKVETRIMLSIGAIALYLNYLEDCSMILAVPVGPAGQNRWFDRTTWNEILNYDQRMMVQLVGAPNLFMAFSGGGKPIIKTKPNWWENPTYMKVEVDEEFIEAEANAKAELFQKIMEITGVLENNKGGDNEQ